MRGRLADEPTRDAGPPHPEELEDRVRKLRWIRPHTDDLARWAAAIGRCRYWVACDRRGFAAAAELLRPEYVPPAPGAAVLQLPTRRAAPAPPAAPPLPAAPRFDASDAALAAWIRSVLPDAGVHHAAIVTALRPVAARALALEDGALEPLTRQARRRLRKLRAALADAPAGAPAPAAPASRDDPEEAAPSATSAPPAADDDPVRDAVVRHTRDKRALVLTNRDDAQLRDRLRAALAFAHVECVRAEPRRVAAAREAVAAGRFDVVLAATGFLGHAVDGAMRLACDRAGVPYLRVAKGRPATCARVLARHFGLAADESAA